MIKIFRPNCNAVVFLLNKILVDKNHLGKTIESFFLANRKLGSRDRNFIASQIFESIRYKRKYLYLSKLNDVKSEADCWLFFGAKLLSEKIDLPNWFPLDEKDLKELHTNSNAIFDEASELSYTTWFYDTIKAQYPKDYQFILAALNEEAKVCIKVNTLKTSTKKLATSFSASAISFQKLDDFPYSLVLDHRSKVTNHHSYINGEFELQDISSQSVVYFCELKKGMNFVDACAGAGGKSLLAAQIMNNKGQILALDIFQNKLNQLDSRALKSGAKNITTAIANNEIFDKYAEWADLVLVDAPCSGSGVIKRNPENKWQLEESLINDITNKQSNILIQNAKLVKPGGYLVYATCSILKQENENVVEKFLLELTNFKIVSSQTLLPGVNTAFDGFYMTKLKRKD